MCAISYSNLQRYYFLPAFVLGILIDEADGEKLRGIKTKEHFQPNISQPIEPFDLRPLEAELSKYSNLIIRKQWEEIPSNNSKRSMVGSAEIISAYNAIITKLVNQDLEVMGMGVNEVRVHETFKKTELPQTLTLNQFLIDSKTNVVVEKKGEFSDIVQLARLIVWHRYLALRRENTSFVKEYLKDNQIKEFKQIIQMNWPFVGLDVYVNSFVGIPELVIRNGTKTQVFPLQVDAKISMFPITKCCIGPKNFSYKESSNCVKLGNNLPHGEVMPIGSYETRCSKCRSGLDRLKFGLKGIKKLEQDQENPLGYYRDDFFYIYLSLFGKRLKIGRGRLSRGIARMLEQSCSDALVLYPVMSYDLADKLEDAIVEELDSRIDEFEEYGVINVGDKAFLKDKISMIKDHLNGGLTTNYDLYKEILDILNDSKTLKATIAAINYRMLSFKENWSLDLDGSLEKSAVQKDYWSGIDGIVRGIAGSLLFTENGIVDMEHLYGYLFRGYGIE